MAATNAKQQITDDRRRPVTYTRAFLSGRIDGITGIVALALIALISSACEWYDRIAQGTRSNLNQVDSRTR